VPETVPADINLVSVPWTEVIVLDPLSANDVLDVRAVNVPAAGVVPPIAPGDGKLEVDPPRLTDVPAIVIVEWARSAFGMELKAYPASVRTHVVLAVTQ
jgi:hypothetical protein